LRFVLQDKSGSTTGAQDTVGVNADFNQAAAALDGLNGYDDISNRLELAATGAAVPAGVPVAAAVRSQQLQPAQYKHLTVSEEMLELERHMRKAAAAAAGGGGGGLSPAAADRREAGGAVNSSSSSSSSSVAERLWRRLQQQHDWPDGQVVFESLYSTCNMEDMEECAEMCSNI
jgi:hypothetical protein